MTVVLRGGRRGRRRTTSTCSTTGTSGTAASRSGCCTPTTPRSSSPSSPSSTSCGQQHPDDQLVVLIPVIRPDKLRYRILHNQLDLVLSSALRSRSDVVVARVTVPLDGLRPAHAIPEPSRAPSPVAGAAAVAERETSAPLPHRVALLDERGRALLGVLAPEDLGLPLRRQRAAPAPGRSTPYARAPSSPATRAVRCARCARPTPRRRRAPRPGGTTWLISPSDSARPASMAVAGQRQLQRHGQRDARADEHAAAGREEPALDLGQAERGRLGGHHHVTPQQKLEAAGHGGGVGRPDDGNRDLPLVKRAKPRMPSGSPPSRRRPRRRRAGPCRRRRPCRRSRSARRPGPRGPSPPPACRGRWR